MTSLLWPALAVAGLALAVAALAALGEARWAATVRSLTSRLEKARMPPNHARHEAGALAGLPAPVQRYFRAVLEDGQPLVTAATIHMAGTFNMSATGEQWRAFTSRQRVTTRRPGFLWDARIAMLPGVAVRVIDSYVAGNGRLTASLQGLIGMADVQGGADIARGEFMRYFAEAVWYPTALLPGEGVRWEAVDEYSARCSMADGPLALTLLFRFDSAGLIESFRAEARGGMVDKVMVQAPWEGRFSNYQRRAGMLVPLAGEVAWMRPAGRKTYFRGTVTKLDYEFPPDGAPGA